MRNFTDFGLADAILRGVSAEGYTTPTPIQNEVIPAILARQDVLGIAQTGTGKTAAFVLPLLHDHISETARPQAKHCRSLILTPTRELASQIAANIRAYGQFTKISVAEIVGGVKPGPQIRALNIGADIVVATPGRLEDHVRTGALKLDHVKAIVLDEADQMLDLGFAPAIRRIISKLPAKRQTILLSATMPKQIHKLATDLLTRPVEISVTPESRPIERIEQSVLAIEIAAKRDALVSYLSENKVERAIVFTRTKRGADKVKKYLDGAGLKSEAIHGNKSQGQRERALNGFRKGSTKILVATDIAARGIDVDDVSHVINFDLPQVAEVYVHRIGRTARAGKSGVALTLCTPPEHGLLKAIEKLIGTSIKIEDRTVGGLLHAAAAHAASDAAAPKAAKGRRGGHKHVNARQTPNNKNNKTKAKRRDFRSGEETPSAGLDRILQKSYKRSSVRAA
ncbi:MAG: DEAD/DEAH box helicase [Sneathiella sp.]|nr:MAG: DEAD/DEAH box helicase [Sneathiella sp.]